MQSEVDSPSPELVQALKTRTKLAESIEKHRGRLVDAIGSNRRRIDMEIEGFEKRLRKIDSFILSTLETEGFPPDYKLPEDDHDEASLAPA